MKNYFIPNQNNDYHPHILKKETVIKIVVGILLVEALFLAQVFLIVPKSEFFASVLPGVLVHLANGDRQESNLGLLVNSPLLERAAQLKANDMLARGYFSHTTPDGRSPWYWLNLVGYKYSAAGENLAINFVESKDINDAWMRSPGHRANILNNKFTEVGIAAAQGIYRGRQTIFVVQFFGKPAKTSAATARPSAIASARPNSTKQENSSTAIPAQPTNQSVSDLFVSAPETPAGENPKVAAVSAEQTSVVQSIEVRPRGFVASLKTVLTSPRVIVNLIFIILGGIIFLVSILKLFVRAGVPYAAPVFNGFLILVILASLFYFNHHLLIARGQIF